MFRLGMRHHVFPAKVPPPQRSGNKVVRGYYTRSQLSEAVKQALLGKMSVTQAAIQYKIPRTTVQKHVSLARKEHQRAIDYRTRNQAIRRGLSGLVRNDGFQEQVATHDVEYIGIAEQNKVSRMEFSSEALWYQQPVRIRDQNQSATKVAESALTHTTSKFGSNNFDASSLEMDVAVECEISTEPNNTTKNAGSTSVKENLAGTLSIGESSTKLKSSNTPQQFININPNRLMETTVRRIMIKNEQTGTIVREVILQPTSVTMVSPTIVKTTLNQNNQNFESSKFSANHGPDLNQSFVLPVLNGNESIGDEDYEFMEPII